MNDIPEYRIVPSSGGVIGNANAAIKSIFSEPLRSALISSEIWPHAATSEAPADGITFPSAASYDFEAMEMAIGRTIQDAVGSIVITETDPAPTPAEKTSAEAKIASTATEEVLAAIQEALIVPHADRAPRSEVHPRAPKAEAPQSERPVRRRKQSAQQPPIPVAAHFKLVFICVFALTLLVGAVYLGLAVLVQSPTPAQTGATETMRTLLVAGVGLIFGLLGGKSIQ